MNSNPLEQVVVDEQSRIEKFKHALNEVSLPEGKLMDYAHIFIGNDLPEELILLIQEKAFKGVQTDDEIDSQIQLYEDLITGKAA